jgi:hypothetical protein
MNLWILLLGLPVGLATMVAHGGAHMLTRRLYGPVREWRRFSQDFPLLCLLPHTHARPRGPQAHVDARVAIAGPIGGLFAAVVAAGACAWAPNAWLANGAVLGAMLNTVALAPAFGWDGERATKAAPRAFAVVLVAYCGLLWWAAYLMGLQDLMVPTIFLCAVVALVLRLWPDPDRIEQADPRLRRRQVGLYLLAAVGAAGVWWAVELAVMRWLLAVVDQIGISNFV